MTLPATLLRLASYLSGEFENREQSLSEPIWYVHLRLWQRPVDLFSDDSVTIFAEQASLINLESPYRQRLMRLQPAASNPAAFQVQYYAFKQPELFRGAGQRPELLRSLSLEQVDLLPGCILDIEQRATPEGDRFLAIPPPDARCCFQYNGETRQVVLGFEISATEYLTYDKGVDLETGRPLWGALMGPYRYQKTTEFSLTA